MTQLDETTYIGAPPPFVRELFNDKLIILKGIDHFKRQSQFVTKTSHRSFYSLQRYKEYALKKIYIKIFLSFFGLYVFLFYFLVSFFFFFFLSYRRTQIDGKQLLMKANILSH